MTYEPVVPVAVLNTALSCILKRIFRRKNGTILIKNKYMDWICSFFILLWKTKDPRVNFEKAPRALRNLHVDPLFFIPLWETNKWNSIPYYYNFNRNAVYVYSIGYIALCYIDVNSTHFILPSFFHSRLIAILTAFRLNASGLLHILQKETITSSHVAL